MKRGIWLAALALASSCGGDDDALSSSSPSDAGGSDVVTSDSSWPDSGSDVETPDATSDDASSDPCPTLPIPPTCFGREVMYREWGPTATGDGSYFADQAPYRLGFNRVNGRIWIVKFQLEANTYLARLSAYGDTTAGLAWISDQPCDATFAVNEKLVAWGAHGGGTLFFNVAKNDADATTLKTDPAYAAYHQNPLLRGGHCYYLAFENTAGVPPSPITPDYFTTADDCGVSGDGTCYYLAMDFLHYLHDFTSGQVVAGNVIPGLTE
jgi:hypothetical protein